MRVVHPIIVRAHSRQKKSNEIEWEREMEGWGEGEKMKQRFVQ